jgi:hypothetical protein
MKVNLKILWNKALELKGFKMETYMSDLIYKVGNKDMVNIISETVIFIKEILKMEWSMEKEY